MRFVTIEVRDFGCIDHARLSLGPGLNVLYGPNDLGKSTLAHALRAALLLLPRSTTAQDFKPWHSDAVPRVIVELVADDGRTYRLDKSFGGGTRGQATLHWSNDGRDFTLEAQGRNVDGRLRELLGWGLPDAGGRGAPRGLPDSFLATVLLGRQAQPGTVLDTSLEGDADDSARDRLGQALQALAQDDRFKEILDRAQKEVDLAFTATGAPRRHKDSPFRKVADRIKELAAQLDELDARTHDSNDVRERLAQLEQMRDEATTEREDAEAALRTIDEDLARARARDAAHDEVAAAEAAHADIRGRIEALAKRRDELHAAEASRPEAETVRVSAEQARDAAGDAVRRAETELQQASQGGDAAGRLARQSLLTRQAEAEATVQRAHDEVRALEAGARLAERVEQIEATVRDLERQLARAHERQAEALAQRRLHEGERRIADAGIALRRHEDACARRDELRAAATEAEAAEHRARTAEAAAAAIDAERAAVGLPDAPTRERLRGLRHELDLATARLGGGLAVTVQLQRATAVQWTADDAPAAEDRGTRVEATADRALVMTIEGVGTVAVAAGTAQARAEVERLGAQWTDEGAPVLARLGVPDLAGLDALARTDEAQARAAQEQRRLAEQATARAAAERTRAEALPQAEATVAERERALGGHDRAELATQVEGLDEDALRQRRVRAEAAIAELQARIDAVARDVAEHQAAGRVARADLEQRRAELADVRRRVGGDPVALVAAALDRLAAAEGKREAIAEELVELDAAQAGAKQAATAALERAQAAFELARERLEAASARRQAIDRTVDQLRGAIEVSEADVARLDEPGAREALAAARAALEALPAPRAPVDAAQRDEAASRLDAARAKLARVEAELRKSEGALESVGGQVVREKAAETRAALEGARARERDIELDYAGWRLLVETMRDTENEEGHHLGQALVGPISERFRELTAQRYEGVALGPDLKAEGVQVAGRTHEITDFSEGVQEQMATLLRLTIARQLGSALVLDDHLTQTDPERIAWFRDVLREAGDAHQIVVLTCRPSDYLDDDERPLNGSPVHDADGRPLRAVDLSKVIERARH